MGIKKESVHFMGGKRFEGALSASSKYADLTDLKGARFKVMTGQEIEELVNLLVEIREFMKEHGE